MAECRFSQGEFDVLNLNCPGNSALLLEENGCVYCTVEFDTSALMGEWPRWVIPNTLSLQLWGLLSQVWGVMFLWCCLVPWMALQIPVKALIICLKRCISSLPLQIPGNQNLIW